MDPTVIGLIQTIARYERIIQQLEAENAELRAAQEKPAEAD
jgi:hypothetical protein